MESIQVDASSKIFQDNHRVNDLKLKLCANFTELNSLFGPNHQRGSNVISSQLSRRLTILIDSAAEIELNPDKFREISSKLSSVFSRLVLELIQAHYSTKQREHDFVRLVDSKGCSITNPALTDAVISLLIKLYKAAGQCSDTSFERNVLLKFLLKELSEFKHAKRQVRRVVQTLYKCSCFIITSREGAPGRLKLRSDLKNADELRRKHDTELIKLAQSERLRLPPESWAYILYGNSNPENISKVQSILDMNQGSATVDELEQAINRVGDKYNLEPVLGTLHDCNELINECLNRDTTVGDLSSWMSLNDVLTKLKHMKHLFIIRQCRERYQMVQF